MYTFVAMTEQSTPAELVERLAAAAAGGALEPADLQQLLSVATRAYAARILEHSGAAPFPPFPPQSGVTATEALLVVGEILRAAEISSFELASMLNI
jgi:hypothetical protein